MGSSDKNRASARQDAVASGHGLATDAGIAMLKAGGNAVDAGVAAGIALGILHSDLVNFAGVAPIMIRMANSAEVKTIDGLGVWPAKASVEFFEQHYDGEMPEGILRTVVPAAPSAWITALRDFGTMRFADVVAPAIRYARDGFPMFELLAEVIRDNEARYRRTTASRQIYLPDDRPPRVGENFVQADLAKSLQYMADQDLAAGTDRIAGLKAAHDAFYRGDIARQICEYVKERDGFLAQDDMTNFSASYEAPISVPFGPFEIVTCGAWCQGISLAQAFKSLDSQHMTALGHNTPQYIHHLTEVFKLAFADREQYVTDPRFTDVPVQAMLDDEYLHSRVGLIKQTKAWPEMPPAGDPVNRRAILSDANSLSGNSIHSDHGALDTSYVCAIDAQGNMFSATPSDTSATGEVVPGTGLCPSSRGSQSRGTSSSINCVAPGKRPRLTPNPAIALLDGKPFMTFGTPGGDVQIQAMIQVFANVTCFGMSMQDAIAAPRFASYSYPSSFAPNEYFPGLLKLEGRIPKSTGVQLSDWGHDIQWWPDQDWRAGGVCGIRVDEQTGLDAGADPRRAGTAVTT